MKSDSLISWAVTFFVLAIVAAIVGYGGLASTATPAGKLLFFAFLALAVGSVFLDAVRGRTLLR